MDFLGDSGQWVHAPESKEIAFYGMRAVMERPSDENYLFAKSNTCLPIASNTDDLMHDLTPGAPESLIDDAGDAWHRQAAHSTTNRSANSVTSSQLKWWPPSAVSTSRPACVTAAENSSSLPTGLK
jgi:hypothetical protein